MTYTRVDQDRENVGSEAVLYETLDITSLENAGSEPYTPVTDPNGVAVVGQEASGYHVAYDHLTGAFHVTNIADGSDVAAGTDVGEVRVRVTE
jgi:hypothetical protein